MRATRRGAVAATLALAATSRAARAVPPPLATHDVAVVGAGVFGAWTAEQLRRAGKRVLLIDAWGPAHARASSGGESRLTRAAYGPDEIYTRMAWASLPEWKALSARAGLPIFHETGVLFFGAGDASDAYLAASLDVHRRLGLPIEALDARAMVSRFPAIDFAGVTQGIHEAGFGALMARRAVQTLVADFVRAGGEYRAAQVAPPATPQLAAIQTSAGEVQARTFVFACGPWLPRLFPEQLGRRIFPTRQEIFFFAPPAGDSRFAPGRLPGWADWNHGADLWYGFPDLEARGFKIANDAHGPAIDPDSGDRVASAQGLADARAFMARRFPAMRDAQLVETRVCQYENSSNGDFLIDRHPQYPNVVLVGGGSGHGFKHGPEVGRLAARLAIDPAAVTEPRFSLATKAETQARAVH